MENTTSQTIFTPGNLIGIQFFGGPFALLYAIAANETTLGNYKIGKNLFIFGNVILAIIIGLWIYKNSVNDTTFIDTGKNIFYLFFFISGCFQVDVYKARVGVFLEKGGAKVGFKEELKSIMIWYLNAYINWNTWQDEPRFYSHHNYSPIRSPEILKKA